MIWELSHKADKEALLLADRHYNRQKPGSPQFLPPGRTCALLTRCRKALWAVVDQKHTDHAWPDAWVNCLFRNEGAGLSSELILSAIAATRYQMGEPPNQGIITFVDPNEVRSKNPGYCYECAGFEKVGRTKVRGLLVMQMKPDDFPAPMPPYRRQMSLLLEF